jgi:NAD(P)-dependent dehydrogenase (short-subunit alcohol dehydrogenase family)
MRRILITGAGRGIGLVLARLYAEQGEALVFAGCRSPSSATGLQALARQYPQSVRVVPLEVTDRESISAARKAVGDQADGLDILINNAGVLPGNVPPRNLRQPCLVRSTPAQSWRFSGSTPWVP